MIARPIPAEKIEVGYKAGFVFVTVECGRFGIWTRTVEISNLSKLRTMVLDSDLCLDVQRLIDEKLCDVEDELIDEMENQPRVDIDKWVWRIAFAVCWIAILAAVVVAFWK